MNSLILHGFDVEAIPNLNCSVANKSIGEWYAEGTPRIAFGIWSLAYGSVALTVYLVVMIAMWKLRNTFSVYKIMLSLGVCDMVDLSVNCILTGYFEIVGSCFCTNPTLIYIAGSFALAMWCGECLCCLLLVFNRIVDLFSPRIHQNLFGGYKMNFWLLIPFAYALYFLLFTNPILFNSAWSGWFFSPFILETPEEIMTFVNFPHAFNNVAVVAITCVFYLMLCIVVCVKYGGVASISSVKKLIIIQSIIVCGSSFEASLVYTYVQYFPPTEFLLFWSHLGWQFVCGIPAVVYLVFNKTIRSVVLETVRLKEPSTHSRGQISISGTPNTALTRIPNLSEPATQRL